MSASLRPETQSMAISAPSGMNSFADSWRTCASMPSSRNISMVRMWKNAARGRGELSFRRSTVIERMPCCARNDAMARPVRPPPAIRTGASLPIESLRSRTRRENTPRRPSPRDWRGNGTFLYSPGMTATKAGSTALLNDTPSRNYVAKLRSFNEFAQPEIRAAIASLDLTAGMRVLDVGCGSGEALQWFNDSIGGSGSVTGIDLDLPM